MEKSPGEKSGEKNVNIIFILSKLPTGFFDFYDQEKKAIVLDIFDTRVGESPIDTLREYPIRTSRVEQRQVDLNKDVAGLRPDLRDMVRVYLFTDYNIPYELTEEYGVINLKFEWSKSLENRLARSKYSIYWKVPVGLAMLGGIGYGVWHYYFRSDEPERSCPICALDAPPAHPN